MNGQVIRKMTSEIDLMRITLKQYDRAIRLKRLNEELYAHLLGSLYYLFKYAEKHEITLPEKDNLLQMVRKADFIIDQFVNQPKGNTDKNQPSWYQSLLSGDNHKSK